MTPHETSPTLLNKVSQGDSEAWKKLLDFCHPYIRREASKLSLPSSMHEDVIQEVSIRILQKLETFERQRTGSFRNWISTIARNWTKNYHRKEFQNQRLVEGLATTLTSVFFKNTEDALSDKDFLEVLWSKEREMHSGQHVAFFEDIVFHGVAIASAAEIHGLTIKNAMMIRKRIFDKLETVVADTFGAEDEA